MLVKKTNEDWWQVKKEEGTKAFYVPAQYVKEVRRALMPPQKPTLRAKPTVLDIRRASDENLNRPQPEMSSFGRPSPSSTPSPSSDRVTPPVLPKDANQNVGSPHHCKVVAELVLLHNNNNHHHANNSTLPRTRADSPPLKVGYNHNKSPDSDKASPPCDLPGEGLNKLHNDSESGDELSSSSTEHMQVSCCFTSSSREYSAQKSVTVSNFVGVLSSIQGTLFSSVFASFQTEELTLIGFVIFVMSVVLSVPFLPFSLFYYLPCAHSLLLGCLQISALVPIRFCDIGCPQIACSSLAVYGRAKFIHQPLKHSTSNNFVPHLPDLTKGATVAGAY